MDSTPSAGRFRLWPVVAIAVLGLIAGAFVASKSEHSQEAVRADADSASAPSEGQTAASTGADETAMLEGVQAKLKSTLVLPSDFKSVPAFSLLDVNGNEITEAALANHWSLVFFGYTHCPDVCPLTLTVMKDVVAKMEADSMQPMQVVFVTVDPARDTPDVMKKYVGFFDEDFVGISGDLNETNKLTRALGIVASFTANEDDPSSYTVDHTASMLLVDPELRVRAKFAPPHEVTTIIDDYKTLMAAFN